MKQTRPCLLNRNLISKIASLVKKGIPPDKAAVASGVFYTQFKKWMNRGLEMRNHCFDKGHFPEGSSKEDWLASELHQAVEEAHADIVIKLTKRIEKSSAKSWSAAAWWLDRRAADDFSTRDKRESSEQPASSAPTIQIYFPDNGRGPAPESAS